MAREVEITRARSGDDPTSPSAWASGRQRQHRRPVENIAVYYPGDSYVDWAGADTYDYAPPSWLDSPYAFAVAHDKPFFIAEWGVRHSSSTLTPAEEQAWLGEPNTVLGERAARRTGSRQPIGGLERARGGPTAPSRRGAEARPKRAPPQNR